MKTPICPDCDQPVHKHSHDCHLTLKQAIMDTIPNGKFTHPDGSYDYIAHGEDLGRRYKLAEEIYEKRLANIAYLVVVRHANRRRLRTRRIKMRHITDTVPC